MTYVIDGIPLDFFGAWSLLKEIIYAKVLQFNSRGFNRKTQM